MTERIYSENDASLNTLLELNGEIFPMDSGYWTKIEAYRVYRTCMTTEVSENKQSIIVLLNTLARSFEQYHGSYVICQSLRILYMH